MDKFVIRTPRGGKPTQASIPPTPPIKSSSKDKQKEEKVLPAASKGKETKDVQAKKVEQTKKIEPTKKAEEKKTPIKAKDNKMEVEVNLSSERKTQTPKAAQNTKQKEISPSPPRNTRSSIKDKQDEVKNTSSKKPTNSKKVETPQKSEKKPPSKQSVGKNKMEVEDSGTENLSATESLTEVESSIEQVPQKSKGSSKSKVKILDESEDDNQKNPPHKQIKGLLKKNTPQKTSNKKDSTDNFDEDEDEEEDPFSKFNYKGKTDQNNQKRKLVRGGNSKKKEEFLSDDEDEEEKDEIIEIKKTTNRTKEIAQKKSEPIKPVTTSAAKTKNTQQVKEANQINAGGDLGQQLKGQIIVFTGELDGISRDAIKDIIINHGGKVTGSVSGKTTILVHGSILEDGRPYEEGKKYQQAKAKGTKIMNQSDLSSYLEKAIGKSLDDITNASQGGNRFDKFATNKTTIPTPQSSTSNNNNNNKQDENGQKKKVLQPINKPKESSKYDPKNKQGVSAPQQNNNQNSIQQKQMQQQQKNQDVAQIAVLQQNQDQQLWTHKHQPESINNCVGNQKNIENMMQWLYDWVEVVKKGNKKQVKNTFYNRANPAGADNSSNVNAKACLLSGPPGVGKTTSVRLIAKFMGYEIREWNASDQRSKKSVNQIIGELKSNSILHLIKKGDPENKDKKAEDETEAKFNKKFIILMDEVDGMSSGDRGGNQALIDAIKNTNVPIFCICNDRMNPKVRSLANYCYDIKFNKPPKQDIATFMLKICQKEGYQEVDKEALELVSERFGNDLRQTLNYLEMHFKNNNSLKKKELSQLKVGQKDATVMMQGFEASTQLMQSFKFQKLTLRERIELFFVDYDLIPLLIHQNYLDTIQPRVSNKKDAPDSSFTVKELQNIADASASIAESDILSNQIRSKGNWSLLPNFAFLSSIYPCDKACEDKPIYPRFPEWLGKFQTTKKTSRELREFMISISQSISGSRFAVKFDYIPTILKMILNMLKKGGDTNIELTLNFLDYYHIKPQHLKEHLNDLQYPKEDYYGVVPTETKSKLTREYNKRFSDDSRKIKGPKKAAQKGNGEAKYDKNLDDVIYSETEKQSSGESGDDDDEERKKKIVEDDDDKQVNKGVKSKLKFTKAPVQKKDKKSKNQVKGKKKQNSDDTDEIESDDDQTDNVDSFIDDDDN